jgi:hypothetical protein
MLRGILRNGAFGQHCHLRKQLRQSRVLARLQRTSATKSAKSGRAEETRLQSARLEIRKQKPRDIARGFVV